MSDIYRIRRFIKQEEARPISSDQPSDEHPESHPVKNEELTVTVPLGVNEAESSQMDEDSEVSDEQDNECADPRTPMSSRSEPAHPQVYTPGATPCAESTTLSVVAASQVAHNLIAPPVLPPYDVTAPYYTPPPLVVYMPHPPYQMTLYPVYPVFFPPPAI
jgi:hypothetical protein